MKLTNMLIKLPRGAREKTVKKYWQAEKVSEKWSETAAAKKSKQAETRAGLTDFERFKVMVLKQNRAHLVGASK